jgi:hypothetical protein
MSCVLVWAAVASASELPETMSIGTSVAPKPHIIMLLVDVSVLLVDVCTQWCKKMCRDIYAVLCHAHACRHVAGRPGWSWG